MKKIIAGNWKLFKNPQETRSFFSEFLKAVPAQSDREFVFFPPATSLEAAADSLKNSPVCWGSQNCGTEVKGAFTGEVSAQVVKDLGGKYVLLGHSERRSLFFETDAIIAQKLALAQSLGLTPMLCIGETLKERESQQTLPILKSQLEKGLAHIQNRENLVIAYEPVWAIGTGKVATTEQIREAHQAIAEMLKALGMNVTPPILYGGSVKPENAAEIGAVPFVGGFLVGGASLEVSSFKKICEA